MTDGPAKIIWYHLTAPQIERALLGGGEPADAGMDKAEEKLPKALQESYALSYSLWPTDRHIALPPRHKLSIMRLLPLFIGQPFRLEQNKQGGEKLMSFLIAALGKTPCWYAGIRQGDLQQENPAVWLAKEQEIEAPWLRLTDTVSFLKLVLMAEIAESQRFPHSFYPDGKDFLKELGAEPAVLFDPRKTALGYGNFWDAESGQVCFAAPNESGGCSVLAVRPSYAKPEEDHNWPMSYMISNLNGNVERIRRRPPPPFDWPSIIKKVNPDFTPSDFILPADQTQSDQTQSDQPVFEQPDPEIGFEPKPLKEYSAVGKMLQSAEFLRRIPGREQLKSLALGNNYISDLTPFAGLDNLRFLSLNGNPVSDLAPIAGLARLNTLMLNSTLIDNEALPVIKGFKRLGSLDIADTKVTDLTGLAGYRGWGLEIWGLPGLKGVTALGTMKKLSTIYVDAELAEGCDISALLPQMVYCAEKNGIVQFASASYFED